MNGHDDDERAAAAAARVGSCRRRLFEVPPGEQAANGHERAAAAAAAAADAYEGEYDYVVGVVNPASGECGAAQHVLNSLRVLLGAERVVTLDGPLFANPALLIEVLRNHAVRFTPQKGGQETTTTPYSAVNTTTSYGEMSNAVDKRGTVVVSGGDGTVAFVMEQLDALREIMEKTLKDANDDGMNYTSPDNSSAKVRFVLPAVAVLALGTGNDYSNSMGFGGGYTRHKLGGVCCCMENPIEPLVQDAIAAPAVPFDRWMARIAPLSAISEQQQQHANKQEGSEMIPDETLINRLELGETVGSHPIDWDALDAAKKCLKYSFINYFSIGLDAYVLEKFDTFRKRHPSFCSTRCKNKLVYGMYGLKAVFRCSTLRPSIPAICVSSMTRGASGFTTAVPQVAKDALSDSDVASGICKDNNKSKNKNNNGITKRVAGAGGAEKRAPMTTLRLPHASKALLVTNVNSYAAGTHPWKENRGRLYRDDPHADPMILTPVSVNDHKMEVQALNGLFHMGMLQLGIGNGANKLAQTRELLAFVLCGPEDIAQYNEKQPHRSDCRSSGEENEEGYEMRTPLSMQVDGEFVARIVQPTVLHITELRRPRVFVRCRNPKLLRPTSRDGEAVD